MLRLAVVAALLSATAFPAPQADKSVKETFGAGGRSRTYYRYIPSKATLGTAAPSAARVRA